MSYPTQYFEDKETMGIRMLFEDKETSIFSEEESHILQEYESKKKDMVFDKEYSQRIKSQSLWIHVGNNNTKLFHH